MKIIVDEQGKQMLQQMCDVALKAGGLQNMQAVLSVLNSIKLEEEEDTGKD